MRKFLVFFFLAISPSEWFIAPSSRVQMPFVDSATARPHGYGQADLSLTLHELSNPFSLVCVATHITDAEYATLAYYRYKFGVRIGIIFALRDESGGDDVGGLISESVGTAKTRQALIACHSIGADAYFLNLKDAGYTKSADEALGLWGEDDAVKKLLEAFRTLRPDVIVTAHNGQSGDGYQQAIGQVLRKSFLVSGIQPGSSNDNFDSWRPTRLYIKTDFGDSDTIINLLESNPVLGGTYAETQQFHRLPQHSSPGRGNLYFKLAIPSSGEKPPFGAPFYDGLTLPEKLTKSIAPPILNGRPVREAMTSRASLTPLLIEKLVEKRAEGSVATLRERYGADFFRVVRHIELLERAIALSLGIRCELHLPDRILAQGDPLAADLIFHNGSEHPLSLTLHTPEGISLHQGTVAFRREGEITISPFSKMIHSLHYETPNDFPLTLPHSRHLYDQQYYPASRLRLSQEPFGRTITAFAEIGLGQTTLSLPALQTYDVAPPVEISFTPPFAFVKDWSIQRRVEVEARVRNRTRGTLDGALWVVPLALTDDAYQPLRLRFVKEDEETTVNLQLQLPVLKPPLSPDILVEFRREKPAPQETIAAIKIPVKLWDCIVASELHVGYIAQPDSPLPPALAILGVRRSALRVEDLSASQHGSPPPENANPRRADLSHFDTVVVDALAFTSYPDLLAKNRHLLDYARRGGNLIVLYQRDRIWDDLFNRSLFTPFPLALSGNHIANEGAAIKFLNAEHPLMRQPNQIIAGDFAGWSRNRAFYLPKHWSTDYEAMLESADAGEEPRKGLLLFARCEAGSFIYTSLDLPGQLAAANPGAYRLLANLISLPKFLKPQQPR